MYSQRITRENPLFVGFMVDQSGSMAENIVYEASVMTKADLVALFLNRHITEMVYRSKNQEAISDYFHLAVIGYGGYGVKSLLGFSSDVVSISKIFHKGATQHKLSRKVELVGGGTKVITSLENLWVSPYCQGATPMGEALDYITRLTKRMCTKFKDSAAAVIVNITDGEPSDCGAEMLIKKAEKLRLLSTNHGNVIFMNIHLGVHRDTTEVIFPSSKSQLPSVKHAELLYDISSELPSAYNDFVSEFLGYASASPYKAMSYNASIADFFSMLNIGTVSLSFYKK